MIRSPYSTVLRGVALVLALTAVTPARADLTLTTDGINLGFTLSKFITTVGFNGNGCCGPLGLAVNSDGNVIVDVSNLQQNYVFNDVDGQTLGTAISHTPFAAFPPAYANSGGVVYGHGGYSGYPHAGQLIKFNNDGSINTATSLVDQTGNPVMLYLGMWTNPVNGHLIAEATNGLYDINVSGVTPTARFINSAFSDGVSVSPDGKTVYTSTGAGYDIATGNLVYGPFPVGGADGTGVITSTNSLNGDIIVNSNFGDVVLLDALGHQTIIANGGTRGDYVSPDQTNGTLFLTQSDEVFRLGCGPNCSVGGGPAVPEPSSIFLLGSALFISISVLRRKTRTLPQ
jgi:hypothetical protein